jgi:hypothetical protein
MPYEDARGEEACCFSPKARVEAPAGPVCVSGPALLPMDERGRPKTGNSKSLRC